MDIIYASDTLKTGAALGAELALDNLGKHILRNREILEGAGFNLKPYSMNQLPGAIAGSKKGDIIINNLGPYTWYLAYHRGDSQARIIDFPRVGLLASGIFDYELYRRYARPQDLHLFQTVFHKKLYEKIFPDLIDERSSMVCYPFLMESILQTIDRDMPLPPDLLKAREDNGVLFGYFGRISSDKNFHVAIDAFISYARSGPRDEASFIAAGPADKGNEEQAIKKYLEQKGVDPGRYHHINGGKILDHRTSLKAMGKLDCIIFPSCCFEPGGRVVVEASAMGIPIIAPLCGAMPEYVPEENLSPVVLSPGPFNLFHLQSLGAPDPVKVGRLLEGHRNLKVKDLKESMFADDDLFINIILGKKIPEKRESLSVEIRKQLDSAHVIWSRIPENVLEGLALGMPKGSISFLNPSVDQMGQCRFFPMYYHGKKKGRVAILSPHVDDAVLSMGATLFYLAHREYEVEIVNLFSGPADEDLKREERMILEGSGVKTSFLDLPKGMDRGYADRFSAPNADDPYRKTVRNLLESLSQTCGRIYCPLGVGGHVDHLLMYEEAARVAGSRVIFYEDMPYSLIEGDLSRRLKEIGIKGFKMSLVSVGPFMDRKIEASRGYKPQVRELERHFPDMVERIRSYGYKISGSIGRSGFYERFWRVRE